ncbi:MULTISPECIES: contractile injection system protein, VgrG/Pvc8 family [Pseudomonas]|uniref:contractile injection system protein, VgrG/Pvc8 family n=1 Tax=Pseudomonas TaxID=286 RepID=UPI001AE6F1FE|nr:MULTISPECIES: contractile injection system protein, VgrG/Pvc8 family [unclassified Pseudomonas]MBP1128003.1 uncharacterized protein involved in type VI secretion and phage assembly [Pseudomonas sp. PvP025]MDQ0396941.1 uncharacterized protein involved in type VI secretion and phage assembly [Pseudomonas sp. PvP006]
MNLTQVFATQNRRLIKLITAVNEEQTLLLEHFSGSEALSTLFSFELSLICQDVRRELKSLIGQPAHLEIELADGGVRYIHGHRMAVDHAYQIKLEDGSTVQGLTDASGLTERVEREAMHQARIAAKRDPKGGSQ